jgi:acyl-CoA synthetase (AMP-forming)/AMP-acid ligase II
MLAATAPHPQDDARAYRRGGFWPEGSVGAGFSATCGRLAGRTALVDGTRRLTFADWERAVARAAVGLRKLGVQNGDVVAYQLPNWWEAAVVFLAAARAGAVVNPVLPLFRERELRFILAQSRARVLVIPGCFRERDYPAAIAALRNDLPALEHVLVARGDAPPAMLPFDELLATTRGPDTPREPSVDCGALLMLMYTSGTTAEPKGVLHTHDTLAAEVMSLARVHSLGLADTTLMPSPVTHISGVIHGILTPALLGTTAVFMERWEPLLGLELIARERVTYMVGAPTFLRDLADHPERRRFDLDSLRLFSCGGAEVSADLIRRARASLGCIAKRVYGSTEFPTMTTTDAADAGTMGIETEGRPIHPVRIRIVAEDGTILAAGAEGEIEATGPERFVGYTDPALTAEAFTADGWFRTGDVGHVDAGGYLHVTGRIKDIVIRKGEKFSARELEELIARHPAVSEVAVVALPDPSSGEIACAAVTLHRGFHLSLVELASFLTAAGLARQKLPERLEILSELPHTDSGKVQKAMIRERLLG